MRQMQDINFIEKHHFPRSWLYFSIWVQCINLPWMFSLLTKELCFSLTWCCFWFLFQDIARFVVLSISAAVYCAKSNQYSMSAWQRDQICMTG